MEILGKILGSPARVKVMRLFLLNRNKGFKAQDVAKRSRILSEVARRELKLLNSAGFIKRRTNDWAFDPQFKYASEVEDLLINSDSVKKTDITSSLKKVGKLKFLLVSGVFIKSKESRVDLLIVGDNLKKGRLEEELRKLEAEIGKELIYAVFNTQDFIYRLKMYDKLVRDILDFPHEVVLQARELSTQALNKA